MKPRSSAASTSERAPSCSSSSFRCWFVKGVSASFLPLETFVSLPLYDLHRPLDRKLSHRFALSKDCPHICRGSGPVLGAVTAINERGLVLIPPPRSLWRELVRETRTRPSPRCSRRGAREKVCRPWIGSLTRRPWCDRPPVAGGQARA